MLKIYLVNEKATMPSFATEGSACFDVRACLNMGSDVISYNTWNKKTKLVPK
jgi:dUTPase